MTMLYAAFYRYECTLTKLRWFTLNSGCHSDDMGACVYVSRSARFPIGLCSLTAAKRSSVCFWMLLFEFRMSLFSAHQKKIVVLGCRFIRSGRSYSGHFILFAMKCVLCLHYWPSDSNSLSRNLLCTLCFPIPSLPYRRTNVLDACRYIGIRNDV